MSQIQQVKQACHELARGSTQAAASLAQFKRQFDQQSQQVSAAIGGSAQRKDQEVIAALGQAARAVQQAQQALEQAGRVAAGYGQSL